MRRLPLASTALVALNFAAPAFSADLPVRAPVKAPVAAPLPAYDWTGFYLGGHIGGAWDHRDVSLFDATTGSLIDAGSGTQSSVMGGGQIGFNFALAPHWIAGIEADISGTDLHGAAINTLANGAVVQLDNRTDLFGTARGRLGYALNNWLLYGTGGFAWANEKITRTQLLGAINNATPGTTESPTATGTGWVAGAGLEWGFARHWTARIEYLHLDLGTQSFAFPLAAQRRDADLTIDTVRFGVNYLFNPGP